MALLLLEFFNSLFVFGSSQILSADGLLLGSLVNIHSITVFCLNNKLFWAIEMHVCVHHLLARNNKIYLGDMMICKTFRESFILTQSSENLYKVINAKVIKCH